VALAKYDNVVKAFPSDRTDQPFSISILPSGARRRGSIADAYRSESADSAGGVELNSDPFPDEPNSPQDPVIFDQRVS
jgi:hypothetical protein